MTRHRPDPAYLTPTTTTYLHGFFAGAAVVAGLMVVVLWVFK